VPRHCQRHHQHLDERGEVLDSASPRLAKLRQEQRAVHGRIQDKLQRILNSSMAQYLQEPIITQRGGRYVIPVRADAKGRLKGIVHDQSGSGATLWVEPLGTVDLNNEYRGLLMEEQEEIQRILRVLSESGGRAGDSIKRVVDRMAELDLIFARANYALVINGVEPTFLPWRENAGRARRATATSATSGRRRRAICTPARPSGSRPPATRCWTRRTVVPTNLTLEEDVFIVLITGPNTGGKTVSLKTMG
jgi:DNA mismatch repair protein MutS2